MPTHQILAALMPDSHRRNSKTLSVSTLKLLQGLPREDSPLQRCVETQAELTSHNIAAYFQLPTHRVLAALIPNSYRRNSSTLCILH